MPVRQRLGVGHVERGAAVQAAYGTLHVEEGLLVGVPAVGGVLAGTWLQQRLPTRWISLLFAALLAGVAIQLVA